MKRFAFSILALVLLTPCPATAQTTHTVKRIADGDTITVTDGKRDLRVRFACIDTAEVAHNQREAGSRDPIDRNQYLWGDRATARLRQLLAQSRNRVLLTITSNDRYGRAVAEVRLTNGTLVQETLTREGLARAYRRYYQDCPSSRVIDQAEAEAQRARSGTWSDFQFLPPWEFRQRQR